MRFKQIPRIPKILGILVTLICIGGPVSAVAGAGDSLYQEKCAMCHGQGGKAALPGAPNFADGDRMEKPDNVLTKSVKNGLNAMPPYNGMLSDSQISDILAYVRKFKR